MFIRDPSSSALVASDQIARDKYRLEKKRAQEYKSLRAELDDLKSQVSEINKLVRALIEKNNG